MRGQVGQVNIHFTKLFYVALLQIMLILMVNR